jgi:flagellar protein FliO/FliZ
MRALLTFLSVLAVSAWLAAVARAAEFEKDTTPLPKSVTEGDGGGISTASSGSAAIARMIVGLLIVLAVVYGIYWLLKKRYRGSGGKVADGRLELVATTALAGNRAVHLLRAGDELFLIGASEQSITGLRAWGPEEARRVEAVLSSPPPVEPQPTRPVGLLDALRKLTVRS